MSFFIYDITFLIAFTIFIIWFLYTRRKNLQREGILYLYRTKFGMKAIDYVGTRFKKNLNFLQYLSIGMGYILMASILYLFFQIVWIYIKNPEIVRAVKIPPIVPLIPYLPAIFKLDFLPPFYFTYWILILIVVAVVHEFAHGIFAKFHGVKIKSTGFGFLGPFLAAFVEPDEKQMEKKPIFSQLSILSAGTFANVVTAIIFVFIFILFFNFAYAPSGAVFNTYSYSIVNLSQASSINGILVSSPSLQIVLKNLNFENANNLTELDIKGKNYYIDNNYFLSSLDSTDENMVVFDDTPALNASLIGIITEFNGKKINNYQELGEAITSHSPGDEVTITTKVENETLKYKIKLADDGKGNAFLGVGILSPSTEGIRGKIYLILRTIREPGTFYEPSIDGDLVLFIYDLLWWMILINISVALINMLPLGIFDGGRVFYLTALKITKSDEKAKNIFKFMTMLLLFMLGVIMLFWFFSVA